MDTMMGHEIVLFKFQMRLMNESFGLLGSRSLVSWALRFVMWNINARGLVAVTFTPQALNPKTRNHDTATFQNSPHVIPE